MSEFFEKPILNSPYGYPSRHWELDREGQPTHRIIQQRRPAEFLTPIPQTKKRKAVQQTLTLYDDRGISTDDQQYSLSLFINSVREKVNAWRQLPNPQDWKVTPTTARLLQHWRQYDFQGIRPFFCQIEAVETAIWLAEVAPKLKPRWRSRGGAENQTFLEYLEAVNGEANPELFRIALKLATRADAQRGAPCPK